MRWFLGAFCALFGFSSYAMAQGCGANYKVQSGDSLPMRHTKTRENGRQFTMRMLIGLGTALTKFVWAKRFHCLVSTDGPLAMGVFR